MKTHDFAFDAATAKKLIKEKGRTTEYVARYCAISESYLRHVLCGDSKPSASVVRLMAQVLEIDEAVLKIEEQAS